MSLGILKLNYSKLIQVIPDIETIREYWKLKTTGFMDLNVDVLQNAKEYKLIALSHYYKHHSGDMIPDPDMELSIIKGSQMVEAMTYQDMYRYQQVYGEGQIADEQLKISLNTFLSVWLSNLIAQGHR